MKSFCIAKTDEIENEKLYGLLMHFHLKTENEGLIFG